MQKSSTSISVIFLTFCCDVAVFLGAIIVLWMVFDPELQELICLSFGAGSLICQFKVAKLMSDEGVADPVTSLIFAIFLVPILYVVGWLYVAQWNCRQLMVTWTGFLVALLISVVLI